MPLLRDIERLLKKPVPRRQHSFPMEVFEAPKKDAKGRVINADDDEARQAARQRNAQRKAEKAAGKLTAPPAKVPKAPPAEPPKAKAPRRPMPHGKQELRNLQAFLDAQPDPDETPVSSIHRDPLDGEVIMDATARLLSSKPVYHYYTPNAQEHGRQEGRRKHRGKAKEKRVKEAAPVKAAVLPPEKKPARRREPPKKGAPAPVQRTSQRLTRGGKGRIPPRPSLPQSRQKDSTEQKSLMKPFYIDHD